MSLRRIDRTNGSSGATPAEDVEFGKLYPTLAEYLTAVRWDDGKPREVATMLLVTELGMWKACLNDRANNRSAWFTGVSVSDLLETIDNALEAESAGWRVNKPYGSRKG